MVLCSIWFPCFFHGFRGLATLGPRWFGSDATAGTQERALPRSGLFTIHCAPAGSSSVSSGTSRGRGPFVPRPLASRLQGAVSHAFSLCWRTGSSPDSRGILARLWFFSTGLAPAIDRGCRFHSGRISTNVMMGHSCQGVCTCRIFDRVESGVIAELALLEGDVHRSGGPVVAFVQGKAAGKSRRQHWSSGVLYPSGPDSGRRARTGTALAVLACGTGCLGPGSARGERRRPPCFVTGPDRQGVANAAASARRLKPPRLAWVA